MKAASAIALTLALSGCASVPEQRVIPPVTVKVPVPTPCLAETDIPHRPTQTPNRDLRALDDYGLALRLQAERVELMKYAQEAEILLRQCAK